VCVTRQSFRKSVCHLQKNVTQGEGAGHVVGHSDPIQTDARESAARTLLSPGMSAQVEIITGRRRVIDYVLSPIARATRESGRER
jgi:hypothetical protein